MYIKIERLIFILLFTVVSSFISGQVVLTNPGFPEKETILYSSNSAGKVETIKSVVEYKTSGNDSWLEYRYYSNERDLFVKLDEHNLNAFYSEVWERQNESSIHSINEILINRKQVVENELLITDMNGFILSLRGYPWKKNNNSKIVFLNRSSPSAMELKIKGKETIYIDDQAYECWKVQLGMGGIMGAVFPKSYFWFSVEAPHYLVRSEASAMPGSPTAIVEIQSYTVN